MVLDYLIYLIYKILDPNKTKTVTNLSTIDQYKLEELETSLLIQKDENDALKCALKSTLEAKEEGRKSLDLIFFVKRIFLLIIFLNLKDLRLYVEMLESTKRVFLDGLKQYKQLATDKD